MLFYFKEVRDKDGEEELGVSVLAIVVSVLLAASHAILEFLFLFLEA